MKPTHRILAAIEAERKRVRSKVGENWPPQHDDEHDLCELASAAAAYALTASGRGSDEALRHWPFDSASFKPKGRVRDLLRSGQFIVAELERIERETGKTIDELLQELR